MTFYETTTNKEELLEVNVYVDIAADDESLNMFISLRFYMFHKLSRRTQKGM